MPPRRVRKADAGPGDAADEAPDPVLLPLASENDESTASEPGFVLDLAAVADVDGLAEEVTVLRASIRQLARNDGMVRHVKVLAELRHQIEALCTALKTKQALEGRNGDGRAAELTRVLEELGDELGVPR